MINENPVLALWPHFVDAAREGAVAGWATSGQGNKDRSDDAAVQAIRKKFNTIPMCGKIVIGEGERDDAPMLYIGEKVGLGHQEGRCADDFPGIAIAIDPLEGTTPCSRGENGAISVIAWSEEGGIIEAADGYMEKLVVGPSSKGKVRLDWPVARNLQAIADGLRRPVSALVIAVLDRARNQPTIDAIRQTDAKVKLIDDGDLSEAINAMVAGKHLHAVMGSGGAPEGHITAAVALGLNGEIQGRYLHPDELKEFPRDRGKIPDNFCERMQEMGIEFGRIYSTRELAPGRSFGVAFVNVTDGVLDGHAVRDFTNGCSVSWTVITHHDGRSTMIPSAEFIEITDPQTAFRLR